MCPGATPHPTVWNLSDGHRKMDTGMSWGSGLPALKSILEGSFLRARPAAGHFTTISYPDAPRDWWLTDITISETSQRIDPLSDTTYFSLNLATGVWAREPALPPATASALTPVLTVPGLWLEKLLHNLAKQGSLYCRTDTAEIFLSSIRVEHSKNDIKLFLKGLFFPLTLNADRLSVKMRNTARLYSWEGLQENEALFLQQSVI